METQQAETTATATGDATKTTTAEGAKTTTATAAKETSTTEQVKTSTQATGETAKTVETTAEAELDIKLPEGMQVTERLGKFKTIMSDKKMTTAQKAQAIVDMDIADRKAAQEQQAKDWEQTKTNWAAENKKDPTFGGKNFDASNDAANKLAALVEKKVPGFVKMLADTGFGNHPLNWKALAVIGQAIADDKLDLAPAGGGGGDQSEEAMYREMFPNSPSLWKKTG